MRSAYGRRAACILILGTSACSFHGGSRAPAGFAKAAHVASLEELHALELEPRIGSYAARDAVWLARQPIVVNGDYPFGLAFGVLAFGGAGVAAAKRRKDAVAVAERLSATQPLDPAVLAGTLVDRCGGRCPAIEGAEALRVYGVVFGDRNARLRVCVELPAAEGGGNQYCAIGPSTSVDRLAEPGVLARNVEAGLAGVATLLNEPEGVAAGDRIRCALGGSAFLEGAIVAERPEGTLLVSHDRPITLYALCPADGRAPRPEQAVAAPSPGL